MNKGLISLPNVEHPCHSAIRCGWKCEHNGGYWNKGNDRIKIFEEHGLIFVKLNGVLLKREEIKTLFT